MSDLSSIVSTLTAGGHVTRLYLGAWLGSIIFQGTVSGAHTFPITTLTLSGVSGTAANVRGGMRVVVETSGGAFKGQTNVRHIATPATAATLNIRELSKADIAIGASDVIKVYDRLVLADKLVVDDASFAPDGLTYTDELGAMRPLVTSGGHFMGVVDAGQTYATVTTNGASSVAVDEDSGGTLTHLWTLPAGVAFAPGSVNTDASPTLRANVGDYAVLHAVTDSSNSKTWTQEVYIRVFDDSNPPYEIDIDSLQLNEETGGGATVRLYDSIPLSALPDGSPCCIFEVALPGSYGNQLAGRSHMKMVGYIEREQGEGDADSDELTFEIVSPMSRLAALPGFSKVLDRIAAPANWHEAEGLTTKRALIIVAQRYTNLNEQFDMVFENFQDYDYPAYYLQSTTTLEQLKELADGADARITCDRTGRFSVHRPQDLTPLAARSSLVTTLTLTDDMIISYRFSREHFKRIKRVECQGFSSATTVAATAIGASLYPGTPGRGSGEEMIERLIWSSQVELNQRCGRRGARADGVYIDSSNVSRMAVQLDLELFGSFDVFDPAYPEWVAITGGAIANLRGITLSDYRFRVTSVSVNYFEGTATTSLTLVSETNAPEGVTKIIKISDGAYIDITPPDDYPLPGDPLPLPDIDHYQTMPAWAWCLGKTDGKIFYATSFDPLAHTFDWVENVYSDMSGTGMWGCSDPFQYSRKFVLTDSGLYKTENIITPTGAFTLVADNATMLGDAARIGQQVFMSINRRGIIYVMCGTGYAVSVDYGKTWHREAANGGTPSWNTVAAANYSHSKMALSPRSGGARGVLVSQNTGTGLEFFINEGWGLAGGTWTLTDTDPSFYDRTGCINIPFNHDDGSPNLTNSSMQIYAVGSSGATGGIALFRSDDAGDNYIEVYEYISAGTDPNNSYSAININERYVYWLFTSGGNTVNRLYRYDRAAGTGSVINSSVGLGGRLQNINGWPYGTDWLITFAGDTSSGTLGGLFYSDDGGLTFYNITPAGIDALNKVRYAEFDLAAVQ